MEVAGLGAWGAGVGVVVGVFFKVGKPLGRKLCLYTQVFHIKDLGIS